MSRRRLLLVDGHAYAYRAFYAIRRLQSPGGEPTNAIYGFIKMVGKLQEKLAPSHLVVVWDGGLAAERLTALPEYKAQRPAMPDDLAAQIDSLREWLTAAGIAAFCEEGVEADDWIATAAREAKSAGLDVVIASSDKDFMQLVADGVGLFNPGDKSEKIWTAVEVRAKTGVEPEQIVDWLSLIGDAADNIPGVPGVGPKTATDLLNEFRSVAALIEGVARVKSKNVRDRVLASAETVRRNQKLIRLKDDLPFAFSVGEAAMGPKNVERLRALYARWGFRGLLAETETLMGSQPQATLL